MVRPDYISHRKNNLSIRQIVRVKKSNIGYSHTYNFVYTFPTQASPEYSELRTFGSKNISKSHMRNQRCRNINNNKTSEVTDILTNNYKQGYFQEP